jgi:hypothetical protein
MLALLSAARTAARALYYLAELDELLDVFAALNGLEGVLSLHESGFAARVVAAAAHALDEAGALDALLEATDKVYRALAVVFLHLRVNSHVGR